MRTVTVIGVIFRRSNLWSGAQSGAGLTTRRLSSIYQPLKMTLMFVCDVSNMSISN